MCYDAHHPPTIPDDSNDQSLTPLKEGNLFEPEITGLFECPFPFLETLERSCFFYLVRVQHISLPLAFMYILALFFSFLSYYKVLWVLSSHTTAELLRSFACGMAIILAFFLLFLWEWRMESTYLRASWLVWGSRGVEGKVVGIIDSCGSTCMERVHKMCISSR